MDILLRHPITSDDVEFLNSTMIDFELYNPNIDTNQSDSGWCDMATGSRIVTPSDRVLFKNVNEEHKTFLTLKYHDRIIEIPDDRVLTHIMD